MVKGGEREFQKTNKRENGKSMKSEPNRDFNLEKLNMNLPGSILFDIIFFTFSTNKKFYIFSENTDFNYYSQYEKLIFIPKIL